MYIIMVHCCEKWRPSATYVFGWLTSYSSCRGVAGDGNWMGSPSLSDTNDEPVAEWLKNKGPGGVDITCVHLDGDDFRPVLKMFISKLSEVLIWVRARGIFGIILFIYKCCFSSRYTSCSVNVRKCPMSMCMYVQNMCVQYTVLYMW